MKTIVITGSTRGIGFALAQSFLRKGCHVVISGRKNKGIQTAIGKVINEFDEGMVRGHPCNVTSFNDVQELWDFSQREFGEIDIWINNAGISNMLNIIQDIPADEIKRVVATNVLGEMYG